MDPTKEYLQVTTAFVRIPISNCGHSDAVGIEGICSTYKNNTFSLIGAFGRFFFAIWICLDKVHMHNYRVRMTSTETYMDCNCFAIRQAARYVSQLYERHVSRAGITAAQFTILVAIGRKPGVTMAELADNMVMDRTTLVRALKPLQRDGRVASAQQDAGTRAVALHLTDAGRKTRSEAAVYWRDAQKEFEEKYGRERSSELRKSLFDMTSTP